MFYKITRPRGSERQFCYGIECKKEGNCFYIDDAKVASGFNTWGWKPEEVESVPSGERFFSCLETPSLRKIMDNKQIHVLTKKKGKWLVTRPPLLALGPFRYGVDVTKPFEVEDSDLMEKFRKDGFIVEEIAKKIAPKTEPEVVVMPEAESEGSDKPKARSKAYTTLEAMGLRK